MRFLIDAQLPPALAERLILDGGGPSIVWIRLGNMRKHVLLPKFEAALPRIEVTLSGKDGVIELS